jgi:5'-AMP-activated protein kinase regulatory beta subunit
MGNQPSGHPGGPSGQPGGGGPGGGTGGPSGHPHHGHHVPHHPGGGPDPRSQAAAAQARGGYGGYNLPGQGFPGAPGGGLGSSAGGGIQHSYHGSTTVDSAQQQQQAAVSAAAEQMQRSSSDASMTMLDAEGSSSQQQQHPRPDPATIESFLNDDTVPTVFRWEHGGRQVYITGTFNGWSRQIPMHRSGNDFTYIHNLKRGKHAFKFIVDDEWRFAPDQPTVADIEGRINNFIDVTDFKAYTGDREFEKEKAAAEYGCSNIDTEPLPDAPVAGGENNKATSQGAAGTPSNKVAAVEDHSLADASSSNKPDRDGEVFNNTIPDVDEYTKEPPPLPPHLRHIILNKPPQLQDTAALPVPQHVALNHLYCTAIKDNMMVLGITQRYKTKFVTTVYYSPCANK